MTVIHSATGIPVIKVPFALRGRVPFARRSLQAGQTSPRGADSCARGAQHRGMQNTVRCTLVVLASFGCSSHGAHPGSPEQPDAASSDAASDAAPPASGLQMNDIAILLPLPHDQTELSAMLALDAPGVDGALVPQ